MILCQNSTCRFLPRGMISPLVNVDKVYSFRHEIPPVEQSYIQPEVVGFPPQHHATLPPCPQLSWLADVDSVLEKTIDAFFPLAICVVPSNIMKVTHQGDSFLPAWDGFIDILQAKWMVFSASWYDHLFMLGNKGIW